MKDTVILLLFLLAVVGLIIGVCYTEGLNVEKTDENDDSAVSEDSNGVIIPILEKNAIFKNFLFSEK